MDDLLFTLGMSVIPLAFVVAIAKNNSELENFQKQAVQMGYAEYIQQNDKMEFKWKEKTP
jgi:hypothetical protein